MMEQGMVRALAVSAPVVSLEGAAEAAAGWGLGTWFLVAAGATALIYAAYKCGKIIYRYSEMSRNADATGGLELLGRAAREEMDETFASFAALRERLTGNRNAELLAQLQQARIEATVLRQQLANERNERAIERNQLRYEADGLRTRLRDVEVDNRALRGELEQTRQQSRAQSQQITVLQNEADGLRNGLRRVEERNRIETSNLEAQLVAERNERATERQQLRIETEGLRARLMTVEEDNRALRGELAEAREQRRVQDERMGDLQDQINYLTRCMARLPVQDTNGN